MSTIAATSTAVPTGTWNIDPVHSQVGFAVEYMIGTFRGSFSPIEGALTAGDDGTTELKGSADATSVKVQDDNLGTHLLSPDFFDAERAPKITFSASRIDRHDDFVPACVVGPRCPESRGSGCRSRFGCSASGKSRYRP